MFFFVGLSCSLVWFFICLTIVWLFCLEGVAFFLLLLLVSIVMLFVGVCCLCCFCVCGCFFVLLFLWFVVVANVCLYRMLKGAMCFCL